MRLRVSQQVAFIVKCIPTDLAGVSGSQAWFSPFAPLGQLAVVPSVPPQFRARWEVCSTDFATECRLFIAGRRVLLW